MPSNDVIPLPVLSESDVARFWSYVDVRGPDECWPWQGGRYISGYGSFWVKFRSWGSHRISYLISIGDPGPLGVLHRCDNPPCCNPKHLFKGTVLENITDRDQKNRQAYGVKNGNSKLTDKVVRLIRNEYRYGRGGGTRRLAKKFKIGRTTVIHILNGDNWKRVR